MNYSKFSKTVYKHWTEMFAVKHIVQTKISENKNQYETSFIYSYSITDNKTKKEKRGASLSFSDHILLTEERQTINNAYFILTQNLFSKFLESLKIAVSWLKDSKYENLFTVNQEGAYIGVTNNKVSTTVRNGKYWLMFVPAVVADSEGVTYQGIQIKCDNGVLFNATADEFINLSLLMKGLIENFYQVSLLLFNACILAVNNLSNKEVGMRVDGPTYNNGT